MATRAASWTRTLAVAAMLAAGCSPASGSPASVPHISPTLTASASPALCTPTNPCLALVTLQGSIDIVVRDFSDISQAKTVANLGTTHNPEFVSATEFSYADDGGLVRAPLSGSPKTVVTSQAVGLFAWSPDGGTAVYLTATLTGMELHQLHAGQDHVLASLPALPVGGCEVAPCPGPFQRPADKWDFRLSYSPDGAFISVVQNGISSFFKIWTSDGKVLTSSDGNATTMAVWSGGGLYFRDTKGVEVWRAGVISTFLPGVAWIRPKASPGGGQIVYEARDTQGSAHVFVVDTSSGSIRDLGKGRAEPAFLTSRYIWYEVESPCVAAGTCEPSFPGIASGKTYINDLQDGTETESIITSVDDVWPHPA